MPQSYHVIIADDDDGVRAVVARIVVQTYQSVTISAVKDGMDALLIYEQRGADLVITNQAMPQLSGLDLIKVLRARQETVPIVMMSADIAIAQEALAVGASRFVGKPFTIHQLAQAITSLLDP